MRKHRALLAVFVAACTAMTAPGKAPAPNKQIDELSGTWRFTLRPDAASGTSVAGVLALILAPRRFDSRLWINLQRPDYIGVYNADLLPLNIPPSAEDAVPHAGAVTLGSDSAEIVLNPAPDHGAVVLRGRIQGNTFTGTWQVTSYGIGAHGTVTMQRHR